MNKSLLNLSCLLADQLVKVVVGILVGAAIARHFGPAVFGELSFAITLVAIFSIVCKLGIDAIAVREISVDGSRAPAILGTTLWLRFIAAGLCCVSIAIASLVASSANETSTLLTLILAAMLFPQVAETVDIWFQSQVKSSYTVSVKVFAYALGGIGKTVLLLLDAGIIWFAVATVIESAVAAAGLAFVYRLSPGSGKWTWSRERARTLLYESWPYMVSGLSIAIYLRSDQILLKQLAGSHALGIYSAAVTLSTPLYFLPTAIVSTFAPALSRLANDSPEAYRKAICRLFGAMWWITIPAALLISLFSPQIVEMVYGESYSESSPILAIHIFSLVPVGIGVAQSNWIVNERRGRLALGRTLLGALSSVALNCLLIPHMGAVGASISAVASFMIASVFSNIIFARSVFAMQMHSLFYPATRINELILVPWRHLRKVR